MLLLDSHKWLEISLHLPAAMLVHDFFSPPPPQSTATVTITVTDVNDFTPMCDRPNFAFSTEEANRLPIELGAVTASDGDNVPGLSPVGSGQLLYQLASTNPQVTVTPMVS